MSRPRTRNGVPLRLFTAEEDWRLIEFIHAGRPRGVLKRLAHEFERPTGSLAVRARYLLRRMMEQNGAEGGLLQGKVQPDRVPRVALGAAAPGPGRLDVSSPNSAAAVEARVAPCAVSPAPGAAVSGAAPGVALRKEKISRCEREKQRRLKMLAEKRADRPAADNIARKCCACRGVFVAVSRFLFRCEPCRNSVTARALSAQFEAAGGARRV